MVVSAGFTRSSSRHSASERGVTVPDARIIDAGDSAVICELGVERVAVPRVDVDVNARAVAIAAAVRQRAIAGVRDVVPTFRSVTVFFDPLGTDVSAVAAALREHMIATPSGSSEKTIDVPVVYGGDDGA